MALTYIQVFGLRNDQTILRKVHAAIVDVARDILNEATPTPARKDWAVAALKDPAAYSPQIVHYVLIANLSAADENALRNAADSAYKTNVAAAVGKMIALA